MPKPCLSLATTAFTQQIIAAPTMQEQWLANYMSGGGSFISEAAGDVSTISICRDHCDNTSYKIIDQLWTSETSNFPPIQPEITLENTDSMSVNNYIDSNQENCNNEVNNESYMLPSGQSIAHKHFSAGEAVFSSFDVEAGGDHCGIVQLLCQIFHLFLAHLLLILQKLSQPKTKSTTNM